MKTQPTASDYVSTRCLTPAHRDTNYVCVKCEQPTAHWRVFHARYSTESSQPICALCFFKTSDWLGENRQRFDFVIKAIGLRRKASLQRDEFGNLVLGKDADDVLGAIVLHDRFQSLTQRAE